MKTKTCRLDRYEVRGSGRVVHDLLYYNIRYPAITQDLQAALAYAKALGFTHYTFNGKRRKL